MGTTERREREKVELRGKILDAARELFAEHGYEAVTMRKIAEKIEYSATAIYLHFKDKDELIQELCAHDFLAFSQQFVSVVGIDDPIERMRVAGRIYVQFALQHPNHYRLMFMTPHPQRPTAEALERRGDPRRDAYALLRELIDAAMKAKLLKKHLKDVDLVVQTVWASIHGVVSLEIAMTGNKDEWIDWAPVQKRIELMFETLLHGLLR
ncbi:MAG TPA: TetR/AcrR family transcriptional regulator [Planctomycetota bacterium]|nr:TetR/AcrR family transcriptional regulator [Planctomycetota bacterium]